MYQPQHRALVRRRYSPSRHWPPIRAAGLAALAVALAAALATNLGPAAAYADRGGGGGDSGDRGLVGVGKTPGGKAKPQDTTTHDGQHEQDAKGDSAEGKTAEKLAPTAAPLTAYEMPFPCGEVWTGSTRSGHSPSVRAVDFNYPGGDLGKSVLSAAAGTVTTAVVGKKKPSYGQYVVIDHGNGESSLYAHLDSVLVTVGQVVATGAVIGTVGNTGNSSGSHLHFEERVGSQVVDAWFHGALFPMGSAAASLNCGGAPVANPVTPPPTVTPILAPIPTTEIPLAGNLYGGKAAEVAVFRKSNPVAFHVTRTGKAEKSIRFGSVSDQPFLGDWDGDGRVNPGVRNPTTRVFYLRVKGKDTTLRFGKRTDVPVAGNWDGVGAWEVGVWRAKNATFLLRGADGSKSKVRLGDSDDLPVTGDWDGDGVTDLAVYDRATATFTLRMVDKATGTPVISQVPFGNPGDLPVAADWDGNGVTDLGTWSIATATFTKRGAAVPTATSKRSKALAFGRAAAG